MKLMMRAKIIAGGEGFQESIGGPLWRGEGGSNQAVGCRFINISIPSMFAIKAKRLEKEKSLKGEEREWNRLTE